MIEELLTQITCSNQLHALWLNTLSYLENCGARKIAACEHPTLVKEEMLKHAAEEFRHAHHLKRQIAKVSSEIYIDYSLDNILGSTASLQYLNRLDIKICRYLLHQGVPIKTIKTYAYLLTTYAIELRADILYPIYDCALKACGSKVTVKNILIEEQEHLALMKRQISLIQNGNIFANYAIETESNIYKNWIDKLKIEIYCNDPKT